MDPPSLLDLTRDLVTDEATKAAYREDPARFLADRGHGDLDAGLFSTALEHVADALPAPLAAALAPFGGAVDTLDELLDHLAGIDPAEAEATWDRQVEGEADPFDDLDDLGDDERPPAEDLDAGPDDGDGSADPDAVDEPDERPGGLAPADGGGFGTGAAGDGPSEERPGVGRGEGDGWPDLFGSSQDASGWDDADDRLGGFDPADHDELPGGFDRADHDDEPGGFDRADHDDEPGGFDPAG